MVWFKWSGTCKISKIYDFLDCRDQSESIIITHWKNFENRLILECVACSCHNRYDFFIFKYVWKILWKAHSACIDARIKIMQKRRPLSYLCSLWYLALFKTFWLQSAPFLHKKACLKGPKTRLLSLWWNNFNGARHFERDQKEVFGGHRLGPPASIAPSVGATSICLKLCQSENT